MQQDSGIQGLPDLHLAISSTKLGVWRCLTTFQSRARSVWFYLQSHYSLARKRLLPEFHSNSQFPNCTDFFRGTGLCQPTKPKPRGRDLPLTLHAEPHTLEDIEVQLTPELEQQLLDLSAATGRSAGGLVQDATVGHLGELSTIQKLIDSRYDVFNRGRVQLMDG